MERTFVAIKPDGVERGLVGEILMRFEKKGYKIVAMKMMKMTLDIAEKHYAEHIGKPFYDNLVKYMTSGPIIAMVLEGINVVSQVRRIMGKTDPNIAEIGTIRADYAQRQEVNIIHGSDSLESAKREIGIFFKEDEIIGE